MKEGLYIISHGSKKAKLVLCMGICSILGEWNALLESMDRHWKIGDRRSINFKDVYEVVHIGKVRKKKKNATDPVIHFLF